MDTILIRRRAVIGAARTRASPKGAFGNVLRSYAPATNPTYTRRPYSHRRVPKPRNANIIFITQSIRYRHNTVTQLLLLTRELLARRVPPVLGITGSRYPCKYRMQCTSCPLLLVYHMHARLHLLPISFKTDSEKFSPPSTHL